MNCMLKSAMQRVRANDVEAFRSRVTEKLPLVPSDQLVVELAEQLGWQSAWMNNPVRSRRRQPPPPSQNIVTAMGATAPLRQGKVNEATININLKSQVK